MLLPTAARKVFFLSLVSALFAAPQPVAAQPSSSARQQINALVVKRAGEAIVALAQRTNWHNYRYTLNVIMPGNVATLPACSQPLHLSNAVLQQRNLARQSYRATCSSSGASWQTIVTVKADVYLPVVMANEEIARGETLTAGALVMKRYNISNLRGEPLLSVREAEGMSAKRTLRPWQPIVRAQLEQPLLVKRGEVVTITSQTGEIRAKTVGVALKEGRFQESIKVQNSSSERILDATVTGSGEVSVGGTQ